jgi:hypothetical protein
MPKGKHIEPSHETRDDTSAAEVRSRMSIMRLISDNESTESGAETRSRVSTMGLLNETESTERGSGHTETSSLTSIGISPERRYLEYNYHPNGFLGLIKECGNDQEMGKKLLNRYLQVFENANTKKILTREMDNATNHSFDGDDHPQPISPYAIPGKGDFGILIRGRDNIMADLSFKLSSTQKQEGNRQDKMKSFLARVSGEIGSGRFQPVTLSFIPRIQCIRGVLRTDIFDRLDQYKVGSLSNLLKLENVQYHLEVLEILGKFVHEHQLGFHILPTFCTKDADEFLFQKSHKSEFIYGLWESDKLVYRLAVRTAYETHPFDSFSFYFGDTFAPKTQNS